MVRNASVFGNAYAHVAEAVGDAFTVENVTAVDEFLLEFFELAGIEGGRVESLGLP